jgi:hypothetical protein
MVGFICLMLGYFVVLFHLCYTPQAPKKEKEKGNEIIVIVFNNLQADAILSFYHSSAGLCH